MTLRAPSLLALRAFEAAARHSSFTAAAHELHVSQAAISRHVRALEEGLQRPLFRRLHRHVELTAPGRRLAAETAAGFALIRRAVEAARGAPAGRLRISVEPAFAARWLVPRFGRFAIAHPDIEVDFESSDAIRTIGRDMDIAIRFLSPKARKPSGRARKLFSYFGFPIIGKGSDVARSRRRTDADVLRYRLLHDDDGSTWRRWFTVAGLAGYDRMKHLHFNDYSLVLTAALRGQGIALSAPFYVGSQLRSGRLIRVGRTLVQFGEYWLLEARDRGTANARAAFTEWFNREARGLLALERAAQE
jgi:LysR family transcriptional regulator, glycine cleavage system transcriptional activator